jgi:MFS family permease
MSMASDYHSPKTRSRALAFHQSSVYIGTILGSWLGAWIAMHYGWRYGFYIFGGAGMFVALMLFALLREPGRGESETSVPAACAPEDKPTVAETFQIIFRSPTVILLMLAFVGANAVATVFLVWAPTFLKDKFHYDLATAGLSGTVFIHAASALAVPFAGWAADSLSRRYAGARVLVQASGLLAGAFFIYLVAQTQNRVTLMVAMTIFGICKGFYDSGIFASLYDSVEPRARGAAAGVMNTVGWGGSAFGPWLVGRISERGHRATKIENMSYAIAWGSALYVISAALLLTAVYLRRSPNAATAAKST